MIPFGPCRLFLFLSYIFQFPNSYKFPHLSITQLCSMLLYVRSFHFAVDSFLFCSNIVILVVILHTILICVWFNANSSILVTSLHVFPVLVHWNWRLGFGRDGAQMSITTFNWCHSQMKASFSLQILSAPRGSSGKGVCWVLLMWHHHGQMG